MKVGVSTACLFPLKVDKALRTLGEQGIGFTECFFNTPSELKDGFLHELRCTANQYQMEIGAVHPFTCDMETFFFFTRYEGRLADGVELYHRYFEAAAQLHAPYVIFHGEHRGNAMEEEESFGHIDVLWHAAKTHGVSLVHENVARCKGGDPNYLRRMHEALPQLQFVLDFKQALRAGFCAMDFVTALGPSIVHLHASDSNARQDCIPIGEGDFDFASLFCALKEQGSACSAVLELYQSSVKSIETLKDSEKKLLSIVKNDNIGMI